MALDGYGPTSVTGVGTNAGVTVVLAAATAGRTAAVTNIQCSGDAAAVVTLESPAATILWRKRFTAAFVMSENFVDYPIVGAADAAFNLKISASTSNCEANAQGFQVRKGA